jgi:hypothetical protein
VIPFRGRPQALLKRVGEDAAAHDSDHHDHHDKFTTHFLFRVLRKIHGETISMRAKRTIATIK